MKRLLVLLTILVATAAFFVLQTPAQAAAYGAEEVATTTTEAPTATTTVAPTTTTTATVSAHIWPDFLPGYEPTEHYIYETGLMRGYPDGLFRPYSAVTQHQVVVVAARGGSRTDLDPALFGSYPATMEWVERGFLPGTVMTAGPYEVCTRFRFAVMLERYGLNPGPPTEVYPASDLEITGAKLDAWFADTYVTWRGVTRQPRICGQGLLIVQQARGRNVPVWLALGQCWYESQWWTTGLSIEHNVGWGIKDTLGRWGMITGLVQGFADYTTVEEAVLAYFRLIDSPGYRGYVDAEDWAGLLNRYAPAFENDTAAHYATVMAVRRWCEERGIQ